MPHVISIKMYLRLHGSKAYVILNYDDRRWHLIMPPWTEMNCIDFSVSRNEITKLIKTNLLVPDIASVEEYRAQLALGVVNGRSYRLASEIAANYNFNIKEQRILAYIEYLFSFYNHYIINMEAGWRLWITLKKDKIAKTMFMLDKEAIESLINRKVLRKYKQGWKLSSEYLNFKLGLQ